ncbi:carboxymuconolactone decarboxylase family protein [Thermostaphylospora chromogena]|uniref:Alkylhydroperoxidase family enzyme, contains CxxC motif n=1 Tax=Thermostaphylospora chromogena TaxID=35622 RepID=A0A1H1AZG1_9ACTN|nr:carboxymuconolactone decarboxylase family protein [Thermostaphylospora chromogena]SDQ45033.1 hypothetical protein SAMN04489764_0724 [Thermostaphylospora chromogena]
MARIPLRARRGVLSRAIDWYSRRRFGDVLDPCRAYAHNTRVLLSYLGLEMGVLKWNKAEPTLKHLAAMTAAAKIGCAWCLDFGYWEGHHTGLPTEKSRAVTAWRDHPEVYTELERMVMEYAEAMTDTPPTVTDEMVRRLLDRLGEEALVEITALVAVENLRSRGNSAFGLTGQGFSDRCAVPSTNERR